MKKYLIKIFSLLLILILNWFLRISETSASFSDIEISERNIFSAGTLDFSLHSGQSNFVPESKALNLKPGDEVNRVIQIRNEGSLSFQYRGQTEKIFGDDDFCNALNLKAVLEGEEIYEGNLMDFNFPPIEISNSGIDTWHFKVSLPEDSNFENKTCQIKFVFDGWQINSSGFFDQEEIESYFVSASSNPDEEISENEEEIANEDSNEEIDDTDQKEVNTDKETSNEVEEEETLSEDFNEEISPEEITDEVINENLEEETPPEEIIEEVIEEQIDETVEDDSKKNMFPSDETPADEEEALNDDSNDNSNETNDSSSEEEINTEGLVDEEPAKIPTEDISDGE